jgi:competence protein ComEC
MLVYNDRKMLFTGDIEENGENSILNKIDCTVDFLKVPHHGSITSSTIELLDKIKPRIGFISVGRNNFYGHPSEEVINRYESIGTLIYRTDESGLIKLYLDKDRFYIKTFIKENADLTYILEEYGSNLIFYLVYYLVAYLFIKYYWHKEKELVLLEL